MNPKGFAFVNFSNPEMAHRCTFEMDGKDLEGKVIFAGGAQYRSEPESEPRNKHEQLCMEHTAKYQAASLYVKNLCAKCRSWTDSSPGEYRYP